MLILPEHEALTQERYYIIYGAQYGGEFGIGVKPAAEEAGTVEDLPDTVYDTLTDLTRTALDLDRLCPKTTEDAWPRVGHCEVHPMDGMMVELRVTWKTRWAER